jgi:alkyldihydroxyacetonephosphate synthase
LICDPLDALLAQAGRLRLPEPLRWAFGGAQAEAARIGLRAPLLLNRLAAALSQAPLLILGFDDRRAGELALSTCRGEDAGPSAAQRILEARRADAWARSPLFAAGAFVATVDCSATWERLPGLFRAVRRALQGRAFVLSRATAAYLEGAAAEFTFLGLAGDGDDIDEAEHELEACQSAALAAIADQGATVSHESGIGLTRLGFAGRERGEGTRQVKALKAAFDPHGILNPGKLLP